MGHRQVDPALARLRRPLVILAQPAVAPQPRERPLDDFLKRRVIESAADSIGFSVIFAVVSMHKVDRAGNNRSRSNHRAVPHRSSDHGAEADFRAAYARADLQQVPPGPGR